jgi:cell cycle sensor histidine kinase DivJ
VALDELMGNTFSQIAAKVAYSGRIVLAETPQAWLARRMKGHAHPAGAVTITTNTGEAYMVRDRATADGGRAMVFTDITDRVRAEAALAEQQNALADATAEASRQSSYLADLASRLDAASASVDSAKTTLLRTMGHELKTPLNAILGFSELMATRAEKLRPDQVREYAELVHQGGTNLLKIINQIMDLTKISAGRYELQRRALDVGAQMRLLRDEFQARAAARGIVITADDCPTGLVADADEAVFNAMMRNLVENAVTFTSGDRITLAATAGEGGIALTVQDNGVGVAPGDLARILQPFEHGGPGEGREHAKGAGLGLTLVAAFAELHGGRLYLDSGAGVGFCATVTFPPAG